MIEFLNRRNFLAGMSASALAAIYPPAFLERFERQLSAEPLDLIKPKALRQGSTIGIVAPASNVYELEDVNIGKEIIESLGFRVVLGGNIKKQYGYLAGSDSERVADLNEMFLRDDVDGIICLRGGWGSMRILPMIDYARNRK
jgi:muramoyltetrapeptide carboxypeptidase